MEFRWQIRGISKRIVVENKSRSFCSSCSSHVVINWIRRKTDERIQANELNICICVCLGCDLLFHKRSKDCHKNERTTDRRYHHAIGRWGRVSCSMLSGLFGPIGLFRGGPCNEASEGDEVVDWEL